MNIRFLAGFLAIAASIVAWRRAIIIVLILVPLIMLGTWLLLNVKNTELPARNRCGLIVVRVFACYLVALTLSIGVQSQVASMFTQTARSMGSVLGLNVTKGPTDATTGGITRSDQMGDTIREGEAGALVKWTSAPDAVFGHGIGAYIPREGIARDVKLWQTELQYHGLYYWTGAIGIILLISTFGASLLAIRRAFRIPDGLRGSLYVSCVGAVATLIGNATNPYSQAPGQMWPIFLPLIIAGVIFASQKPDDFPGRRILIPKMIGRSPVIPVGEGPVKTWVT